MLGINTYNRFYKKYFLPTKYVIFHNRNRSITNYDLIKVCNINLLEKHENPSYWNKLISINQMCDTEIIRVISETTDKHNSILMTKRTCEHFP